MWLYLGTGLALIGILALAGVIMRLEQAGWLTFDATWFYALLTLHGIGMLVAILLCGMGGLWYVLHEDLGLDIRVPYVVYGLFLTGNVLVLQSTLIGKFDAAWTTLYPLPFVNPTWPNWATGEFLIALTLVMIGWSAWCLQLFGGLLRRYGSLSACLGWDLVFHTAEFKASGREAPPPQAFAALVVSLDGLAAATAGSLVGVSVFVHWLPECADRSVVVQKSQLSLRSYDRQPDDLLAGGYCLRCPALLHSATLDNKTDCGDRLVE
jgi:cytochrome c oxidase subunit 1